MNGTEVTEWVIDLVADYGYITSEMMDELVNAELLTRKDAEKIYDLYNTGIWERNAG